MINKTLILKIISFYILLGVFLFLFTWIFAFLLYRSFGDLYEGLSVVVLFFQSIGYSIILSTISTVIFFKTFFSKLYSNKFLLNSILFFYILFLLYLRFSTKDGHLWDSFFKSIANGVLQLFGCFFQNLNC